MEKTSSEHSMKKTFTIIDLYDKKGLKDSEIECFKAINRLTEKDGKATTAGLMKEMKCKRVWIWTLCTKLISKNLVKTPAPGVYYPTAGIS